MPASPLRVSFIGAGNMGEAMLRGLVAAGYAKDSLKAYDPRLERLEALAASVGFTAAHSLGLALDKADWVVLAVKPQVFPELLPDLKPLIRGPQAVLSIAAGVRLERLALGLAPDVPLVRVMPNTPGLIGQGVSVYCLGAHAGPAHGAQAEALLKPLGKVLRAREEDMDAVTALSGSGPAYVFLFMEALRASGERLGLDSETAFALAGQTLAGAAAMILAREKSPAELRAAVTSPGGTTAAALKVFEDGGFRDLVDRALKAARDRARELGA